MKFSSKKTFESMLLGDRGQDDDDILDVKNLDELRKLGKEQSAASRKKKKKGRVYILPGIMGSTLWADRKHGLDDWIWISPLDLARGGVKKLKIGAEPNPVYARDALDIFYLKMKRSLQLENYKTDYLPYDWRFSPNDQGKILLNQIKNRGEKNVSLVCHSMGGLVARQIAALDPNKKYVKRIITLGTPNYGSYSTVEVFALTHSTLAFLAKLDREHTDKEIVDKYVKYFRGLLEMLPDNRIRADEDYFKFSNWPGAGLKPARTALREAKKAKLNLSFVDDRFVQIVGMNEKTIQSATVKNGKFHFDLNNDGDGTVPRDLAEMGDIDRYYINGKHRSLLNLSKAIAGVKDILESGKTSKLRKSPFKNSESVSRMQTLSADQLKKSNRKVPKKDIDKLLDGIQGDQFLV